MRITAFDREGQVFVGAVDRDGAVRSLGEIGVFWRDPQAAIKQDGVAAGKIEALVQRPAVPRTARVICVGLNYRRHAEETGSPIPTIPVIFARWANTLAADGDSAPKIGNKYDWEGELGAVVGRRMFNVSAEQAANGVFGYFAFNDLSAREYQMQTPQWVFGKNADSSGPMSAVVTADEVGDPALGLQITTKVNGAIKQDSTTADMIFTVPELLAHVSQVMTLEPGDIIVTGTPSGVGIATGEFLQVGDQVEIEIERIGLVRTTIVAPPATIF